MDWHKPPHDFDWSQELSIVDIVGQDLPVHPNVKDKKIGIYALMRGNFSESKSFCTSCLTTTPSIPRSHHKECFNHKDLDAYPQPELPLGLCPECGSEFLDISSCREMEVSSIDCIDCGFSFSKSLCEEDLIELFLRDK